MLADPRLVRWMVQTAENAGVPYQTEILELGWTDAKAIQLTRAGVPAGCISIPARYIHTPSEMVDFDDVNMPCACWKNSCSTRSHWVDPARRGHTPQCRDNFWFYPK